MILTIRNWDGSSQQELTLEELLSQVSALSLHTAEIYDSPDQRQRRDLRECAGQQPRRREVLADPAGRYRKLAIETGYDIRYDQMLWAPLEPWNCPDPHAAMAMYGEIMRAEDGATAIASYHGERLAMLSWMREEELVAIGDAGEVRALSDARSQAGRSYPGAPVSDKMAKIGHYLGKLAKGLILAAIMNLSAGRTVRRLRKRRRAAGMFGTEDGLRLSGAAICEEVNSIKAHRPDLADYQYLSVSRCREVVKELIEDELLEEIEPPRAVRERRSWRTIPRLFRRLLSNREWRGPPG
jgi:hypothetical protein